MQERGAGGAGQGCRSRQGRGARQVLTGGWRGTAGGVGARGAAPASGQMPWRVATTVRWTSLTAVGGGGDDEVEQPDGVGGSSDDEVEHPDCVGGGGDDEAEQRPGVAYRAEKKGMDFGETAKC